MPSDISNIDVLCVGHASYDLVFSVDHHPNEDEKIFANELTQCGGGPAANAAVMVARFGCRAAFAGYLGQDVYGNAHLQELLDEGVNTALVLRGNSPTPLSTILVKPNGKRALINYKGNTQALEANVIDFSNINPKVILFDGHEPELSIPLTIKAREYGIPTVLDAGSLHKGTEALMSQVDYLVASEKFALQLTGNIETALQQLAKLAPNVIITLGEYGLVWQRGADCGEHPAFSVRSIDTTGAGDAFHGAFAAAIACGMNWYESLNYASAAGSLCCTKVGARPGLPLKQEIEALVTC